MNCWEFKRCSETVRNLCPAYPNKGMDCWKVTGTKCEGGKYEKETVSDKVAYCRTCGFYMQYAHQY